ncbi:hypothetical protein HNQ50_003487 [Silvimonas terrae]|uniref:Uncharacterized protein n=1 Tax=Silvimonas terrae TaxID=300266 RepID=A0A840RKJ7_9NEIS|nr:hypothetical protein [Silvimonas terrae]MBB5192733.1 hypothetical protein [Silvimonas terrae]
MASEFSIKLNKRSLFFDGLGWLAACLVALGVSTTWVCILWMDPAQKAGKFLVFASLLMFCVFLYGCKTALSLSRYYRFISRSENHFLGVDGRVLTYLDIYKVELGGIREWKWVPASNARYPRTHIAIYCEGVVERSARALAYERANASTRLLKRVGGAYETTLVLDLSLFEYDVKKVFQVTVDSLVAYHHAHKRILDVRA